VLEGHYCNIPYAKRLCACGDNVVESLDHVLFECSFYLEERDIFIVPILKKCPGRSKTEHLSQLLVGKNQLNTESVAKFFASVVKF
ncbi:hypothetical protein JRQ81_016546, partial [Phrynocephalus forsythii]